MIRKHLYALAFAVLFANTAIAAGPERSDPLGRFLFKPEVIMKFSNRLELSEQQQDILKNELKNAQASIFDLKWKMNEESEALKSILKTTPINEDQLLAQSDVVMALELEIKRVHLILLARLKNMLSEEQIQILRELRKEKQVKRNR